MAENSKIEWTHHTFNPWRGCTKVAAGCANCYAERDSKRFPNIRGIWGPNGTRVVASQASWNEPRKWNRDAHAAGERRRVFCASLADVFEDWGGLIHDHHGQIMARVDGPLLPAITMNYLRRDLFKLIDETPWLDWLLLTKRPENIKRMWWHEINPAAFTGACFRPNVWLLTSVAEQKDVDTNLAHLCRCRDLAPVLGVSAEPLISEVRFQHEFDGSLMRNWLGEGGINWVIVGGESGPSARPCTIGHIREIVGQCKAADVPCFVKQLGSKPVNREGVRHPTRDKKGGDISEFPPDLRIREFPRMSMAGIVTE